MQIENTSNSGIAFYQPTLSKPIKIFKYGCHEIANQSYRLLAVEPALAPRG
jgi:hypothetical protein